MNEIPAQINEGLSRLMYLMDTEYRIQFFFCEGGFNSFSSVDPICHS